MSQCGLGWSGGAQMANHGKSWGCCLIYQGLFGSLAVRVLLYILCVLDVVLYIHAYIKYLIRYLNISLDSLNIYQEYVFYYSNDLQGTFRHSGEPLLPCYIAWETPIFLLAS